MQIIARNLQDKMVMLQDGTELGVLHNITADTETGELKNILLTKSEQKTDVRVQEIPFPKNDEGFHVIPVENVQAIQDHIIVRN